MKDNGERIAMSKYLKNTFAKGKQIYMSTKVYVIQQRTIESQYKTKSYRITRVCQ